MDEDRKPSSEINEEIGVVIFKISGSICRVAGQFLMDDRQVLIILDGEDITESVIAYQIKSNKSLVLARLVFRAGFKLEGYHLLKNEDESQSLFLPVELVQEGKKISFGDARKFLYDNTENHKTYKPRLKD